MLTSHEATDSSCSCQLDARPVTVGPAPELAGSVALVTGGGRGIGRLVAQRLAAAGAAVGLVARSADELAASVALVEDVGGVAAAATADVSDERAFARAVAELRRELGPVDLLVNNAGIVGPIGPMWEVELDSWWRTMEVNVRGVLIGTQLVLPDMIARGGGRVINLASQAGVFRWPMVSGYSVSKAAVVKLTENLARETARYGVSVFSVHPGLLPIGLSETGDRRAPGRRLLRGTHSQLGDARAARRPGRGSRVGARAVMFLATGRGDALSGRHVSVHDDIEAMLEHIDEIRDHDLYVMRPERLEPARDARACA